MVVKQLDNRNRFDVYDRRHDTEGTCVVVTASGTEIRINEDCFKGIDVCVERCNQRSLLSWSDEFEKSPTRVYNFDVPQEQRDDA